MRLLPERGKCQSCGDIDLLYSYNNANTCSECLGMDRRGVSRERILKGNLGKRNDESKLRKPWKSRR